MLALLGCADGRSVVTLTISADSPIGNIDRLHIVATDDVRHRDANPFDLAVAAHTVPPAVTVPLAAPSTVKGALTIAVTALAADGTTVATGTTDVSVAPSRSFSATVKLTPMVHRALRFVTQPATTKPNQPLGSVEVDLVDDAGTTLADATDVVSLTLAGGASGSVLSGHVRVAAVAGVATFPDLSVNVTGVGYTLVANAPMADPATSAAFDIGADVWVPINTGLEGGSVVSIYPDPNDANGAWATALGGSLWRTKDAGASWRQYGATLPAGVFGQFAISSKSSDVIFFSATDKALRRSDDGGASWDVIGNNLPTPSANSGSGAVSVDPKDDSVVYYGVLGALFVSKDRGNNFTALPAAPLTSSPIVLIDSQSSAIYTSGVITGNIRGTYKSTDGGTTWTLANGGIPATVSVSVLAIAPSDGTLYARSSGVMAQVYKSTDGGTSWITEGPNTSSANVPTSFVVDQTTPSTLYGGMTGSVRRSDDSGATWTPMTGLPIGATQTGRVKRAADGTLWANPTGGAPFRSTDNHAFTFAGNGLKALFVSSIDENCANNGFCIGTESRGVFASPTGASWHSVGTLDPGFVVPIFVYNGFALVDDTGFWKTPDGLTWTVIPPPGGTGIYSFGASGNTIVVLDDNQAIWTSTNGAVTWTQSPMTVPNLSAMFNSVIVDPTTTMTSYVWGMGFFWKSTNGGAMYTDVQPDPTTKPTYYAAAMDATATGTLYVSTQGSKLYKTVNGGTAWSTVGQGLPTNDYVVFLGIDPLNAATVYASTFASRLYKSIDGASTFKQVAAPPGIQAFKLDGFTEGTIYAATTMGVWRTTTGAE